jgi:DNA-3-methyladenine glycosylase
VNPFLPRTFFQRDPLTCARELIGCELVWNRAAGIIVEVEAYAEQGDEASHTFVRPSARAFVARHPAGAAYVYMNYGVHWLLNVLVKGEANGFVLIRALEPTRGIPAMQKRRHTTAGTAAAMRPHALCSGPGKLSQALGVTGRDHGRDFCSGRSIGFRPPITPALVEVDVRIGISKAADLPWRFLFAGSPFVSVRPGRHKNIKARLGKIRSGP